MKHDITFFPQLPYRRTRYPLLCIVVSCKSGVLAHICNNSNVTPVTSSVAPRANSPYNRAHVALLSTSDSQLVSQPPLEPTYMVSAYYPVYDIKKAAIPKLSMNAAATTARMIMTISQLVSSF